MTPEILVVAGEASGDQHAARLLGELQRMHPEMSAFGLGGEALEAQGCEVIAPSRDISVVGITEVLKILPRAWQIFRQLLDEVEHRGTRLAVLVDSPEFNLRLAKQLKRRGVRVVYYISPQIWAWRQWRVRQIARCVDEMLVLFPFEVEFFRGHGVPVQHVGHPLLAEIPSLPLVWDAEVDRAVGQDASSGPLRRLALLPGSRASEVGKLLPPMLQAASLLAQRMPLEIYLIQARSVAPELFDEHLAALDVPVQRIMTDRFQAIADCHLALCASGTATLEVGLLGTPLVVMYRLNRISYWLGRMLVKLPHFSLVNLILEDGVVPELLQDETEPSRLADTVYGLLTDPARIDSMRRALGVLRSKLGPEGASQKAARAVARHALELQDQGAATENIP